MRKLFALTLVLFAFNAPGAIKYFTDYPVNANPSNSFALPMDTGDHALGGVPYNYITMEQLTEWLQAKGFTNGAVTIITTNITVIAPGTSINLNLTPNTLIKTDVNDDQASVPNGAGFLTNNGSGVIGWSTVLAVTELDAQNAYLANIFTFLTNVPFLSTDGDGKPVSGGNLSGDVTTSGSLATTLATVNASPGTYGDGTHIAQVTVNAKGLATTVASVAITGAAPSGSAGGELAGTYPNPSFAKAVVTNGMASAVTVSNQFRVDANHAFVASNVTASAVASFDALNQLTNVANATGALTNDGSGGVGYYSHFVPDSRTATIAGTANQVTSSAGAQDFSANRTWTISTPSIFTAPGTIAAVTGFTNQAFTVPGVMTNDDKGKFFSTATIPNALLANSSITVQGAAVSLGGSTLAAGSTPSFSADNITNLSYIIKTNNGGGNALVAGAPGTALTCILTNIAATTTLAAMTFWTAGMSVIPVYATASGGNQILKFPANFQGSGDLYGIDLNGTGITITNAEASWFEVRCIYGVKTNVFRSNTK